MKLARGAKTKFICSIPDNIPEKEVVKLAKHKGLTLTLKDVYLVRWRQRRKQAKRVPPPAPAAAVAAAAAPAAPATARVKLEITNGRATTNGHAHASNGHATNGHTTIHDDSSRPPFLIGTADRAELEELLFGVAAELGLSFAIESLERRRRQMHYMLGGRHAGIEKADPRHMK